MLGAFAEFDRESIIENTTRGRARGAKKGRWYGVVPLGYTMDGGRLAPRDAEILPGVRESDLAREIFERVADGGSAVRERARLAALGLRPFARYVRDGRETIRYAGGNWGTERLARMIRNPIYRGEHVYRGRYGDIDQNVPALVSPQVWAKANRQLDLNRQFSKRNSTHFHLLAGLVRCGVCGNGFQGCRISARYYYQCRHLELADPSSGKSRRRCASATVRSDWLETEVWRDCERFARNPGPIIEEVRRQHAALHQNAIAGADRRKLLIAKLTGKDGERQTIISVARRGTIRPAEAEAQLDAIAAEQREIQTDLDAIANRQVPAQALDEQARSAEALLNEVRRRIDEGLDDETRREVVRQLVGSIVTRTEGEGRHKRARVRVRYLFADPVDLAAGDVGKLLSA